LIGKLEDLFSVKGKMAVVTGGGQGLGECLAKGLATYGAEVAVLDLNEELCQKTVEDIRNNGGKAINIKVDVSKKSEVSAAIEKVVNYFGRIDILVNNAGVVSRSSVLNLKEEDWDKVMDINAKGTFLCCQAAGEHMVKQRYGKIINIASVTSFRGIAERFVYATSKGAVAQITRALAVEWAPYNIHVNAIAPCYLDTPLTRPLYDKNSDFYKFIMSKTPLKRIAKPEELVGGLIYLASDASDMVTGHILAIDGGWLAE